jgi:DNA-binding CsgD family transcriptional regulator
VIKLRTGDSLARPAAVRIARVSEGNPLHAIEIASELRRVGSDDAELPVPRSLTALIGERIARLPARTQETLLACAVLSRPTTEHVDGDALEPAEDAGIVAVADGQVRFVHPAYASAVHRSVDQATRRRLHRELADVVSEPEEQARHLALGSARPDGAIATRVDEAAVVVAARGAPDAAAELMDLAVRLTPVADVDARCDRRIAAARFRFDAGDFAGAQAILQHALDERADGARRAVALQLLSQLHGRRSNFGDALATAAAAREAVGDDDAIRPAIELDLAYCCASLGDFERAQEYARSAVAGAEAAHSETLPEALACLAIAQFLGGRGFEEGLVQRALDLEDPARRGAFMMRPRYIYGALLLWMGRCAEATTVLEALRLETLERGEEGSIPLLAPYLVWAAVWRGDITGGAQLVEETWESAALLGDPAAEAIAAGFSALVGAYTGPVEKVRTDAERALELFSGLQWMAGTIWPLWALGLAALASRDARAVDEALGPLAQMLTNMGSIDPVLAVFLPEEIEALAELGQINDAEQLTAWLDDRAETFDRPWARAVVRRCRGLVEAARGDLDAALRSLEDALGRYGSLDMPIERARTLVAVGRVQRRRKQKRLARIALDEALLVFESVGATAWSTQVRDELARVNTRRAPATLTATEERVARLAAEGFTNRQIAERVFVSPKTVEANLARAYRKLGISSRAQLARSLDPDSES